MSDLEVLRALLDADRWIDRVTSQRDHLPEAAELHEVEDQLRTLASRSRALEADRKPTRDRFNEAADKASTLRHRRDDVEVRLANATGSPRDLVAMQGELEHLNKALSEAEDREVELLLELEPLDEVAQEITAQAQPLVQRRHALQSSLSELRDRLQEEINHLQSSREAAAATVPEGLRRRYEQALKRSGVSGAALLDGGRCDGCRVSLSPLDQDRWRAAPDEFLPCPHCGRLLLPC